MSNAAAATPALTPAAPPAANAAAIAQTPPADAKVEKVRVRGHQRALRVKQQLASSEPAGETTGDAPKTAASTEGSNDSGSSPADSGESRTAAPEPSEADKQRATATAARHERLRKAQERERQEAREREGKTQRKASDGELEKLRKRVAELEPNEKVFSSEEALLAAAEAKGLTADKLIQWMRTRLSDPNAVAQHQVRTEADKLREEMKALQKQIDDANEDRKRERESAQKGAQAQAKARSFLDKVKDAESTHPLTANLQRKHGANGLISFANQFVAPLLRPDYTLDELHDHLEQLLDEVQFSGSGPTGAPANGSSHTSKNGTAPPPTTLSNNLTSGRESVTDETPIARMPRQQRIAAIREKYRSE